MELTTWHDANYHSGLAGRYITSADIVPLIHTYEKQGEISVIGTSVKQEPIYLLKTGEGKKKILMWSQMHGNESTTTKAVIDLLEFLNRGEGPARHILEQCTLYIIPMLNPDGAKAYTRVNANEVDLNRDAADLSQPESFALRHAFDRIKPDFCFNLHDQRTLFNTGNSDKPATLSFLSPATDEARTITAPRKKSMEVIGTMNRVLQQYIPGQVGRYDDSFNINCVGDSFQSLGTPTILFEAGHFKEDYDRDITRKFVFTALITALEYISGTEVSGEGYGEYFDIPENGKLFFDILIHRFPFAGNEGDVVYKDIGIRYKEVPEDGKIKFDPFVSEIGDLEGFYGHKTFDAGGKKISPVEEKNLKTTALLKLFL
ncbi:M14 family zinc carboxypeptidase [Sinomicrobium soli]|uniref:M14 family zinc carboxypeptidase n=1 Tax=Sinomicrobium sp. N-1-3-6 TaxID=2219864 RepID=UPI000DCEF909|nr:M14 family zinc carboxypeptidase [Sinomicrobium sp. N-1-3-6]RAV28751.1 peptidase M14 [Sinomicrobium sp. N-1-3-6]